MRITLIQGGRAVEQVGLWVALNLLDVGLSLAAMQAGAVEVGLVVKLFGVSYWGFIVYKVVMMVAVLVLLTQVQKTHLLRWLNIGMGCICFWNAAVMVLSVLLWTS